MGAAVVILTGSCGTACLSQIVVGLPCPACGMTRAALLFFSGRWTESFQMHPFFYALLVGIVIFGMERYGWKEKRKWFQIYAVVVLMAMLVFYVYRMLLYFPDVPPMTCRQDSLLSRLLQGGHKLMEWFVSRKNERR